MTNQLPLVWSAIIGFGVMMYVILDGFDLGIGILFPFIKNKEHKDLMMQSIVPVWDGNETWLVLGGAALFGAFPRAYATILPALYLPLMIFLSGLILRGVSFEFRFKATKYQYLWDIAFASGSIIATAMQGIVLGLFVEGFPIKSLGYAGESIHWLTPFSVMTALALLSGYALLGATWLIMKMEGALQAWCRKAAFPLLGVTLFFILLVSLWTPIDQPAIAERWFSFPNILYFSPVPFYTAILAAALYVGLRRKSDRIPFIASIGLFFLSYIGLGISLWPYIVPRVMTIQEAASPQASQLFLLTGVLFLLPVILIYTGHSYWVFRGKVREVTHY